MRHSSATLIKAVSNWRIWPRAQMSVDGQRTKGVNGTMFRAGDGGNWGGGGWRDEGDGEGRPRWANQNLWMWQLLCICSLFQVRIALPAGSLPGLPAGNIPGVEVFLGAMCTSGVFQTFSFIL
jgi:hypothetical protein